MLEANFLELAGNIKNAKRLRTTQQLAVIREAYNRINHVLQDATIEQVAIQTALAAMTALGTRIRQLVTHLADNKGDDPTTDTSTLSDALGSSHPPSESTGQSGRFSFESMDRTTLQRVRQMIHFHILRIST
jgi:hypothetical protein